MENFADLLTEAFSDTPVLSFPDEDLDFENLSFDEKNVEETDAEERTDLLEEAAAESRAQLSKAAEEGLFVADSVDEEQRTNDEAFKGLSCETPAEDYTDSGEDSGEEASVSGEDGKVKKRTAEERRDLSMETCWKEKLLSTNEVGGFTERETLTLETSESHQVNKNTQGEGESNGDDIYFSKAPERASEMMKIVVEEHAQDEEADSSDPEGEDEIMNGEESAPSQDSEEPDSNNPPKSSSTFPGLSLENLQDLIAEVEREESVEKMTEFSGEEHQEAGESFADYPSDFSSCEYTEVGGKDSTQKMNNEPDTTEMSFECNNDGDDSDDGKVEEFLFSKDLEEACSDTRKVVSEKGWNDQSPTAMVSSDGIATIQSTSWCSSDAEKQRRRSEDSCDDACFQTVKHGHQSEDTWLFGESQLLFSTLGCSDDVQITGDEPNPPDWDFFKTDTDLRDESLHADETEEKEADPSDIALDSTKYFNARPTEKNENRKMNYSFSQGSIDDSFLFENDPDASCEDEELDDDEEEEDERSWEQEQERIQAFYKFYNDGDENGAREERKIKVQFLANPLLQVIHYESETDEESESGSFQREEDPSSAETADELMGEEEEEDTPERKLVFDPPSVPQSEKPAEFNKTLTYTQHKCVSLLKLILKSSVVIVMGLLVFCFTLDSPDWFRQMFFF